MYFDQAQKLLKTVVPRKKISSLSSLGQTVEDWVLTGIDKKYIEPNQVCPACSNLVGSDWYAKLQEHFSELYKNQIQDLKNHIDWFQRAIDDLPDAPTVGINITSKYFSKKLVKEYNKEKLSLVTEITKMRDLLLEKTTIKNQTSIDIEITHLDLMIDDFIGSYNALKGDYLNYEEFYSNLESERKAAKAKLFENALHSMTSEFDNLDGKLSKAIIRLEQLSENLIEANSKITNLRGQLSETHSSAKEISECLSSYLGNERLALIVNKDNRYVVHRDGKEISSPLSEGEKTAIAFSHFICRIGKDLSQKIIVIDDPISSLDNRNLHYAFQLMRETLRGTRGNGYKAAKQVFVLTHNFQFFKECMKSLVKPKKDKKGKEIPRVELFDLFSKTEGSVTTSHLVPLPSSLKNFDSEYHYFAAKLFNSQKVDDYTEAYGLCNACRIVLEGYLLFKLPNKNNVRSKLELLLDENKSSLPEGHKLRGYATNRIADLGSHGDSLSSFFGFDNVTLNSAKDAVDFTLGLIEATDKLHYRTLKNSIK